MGQKRGVKLIALSCDEVDSHNGWIKDIIAYNDLKTGFSYPIIADPKRDVANLYGMLDPDEKDATPADWKHGGSCMVVPSVQQKDVAGLFPKGVKVHEVPSGKVYLRTTPQPE